MYRCYTVLSNLFGSGKMLCWTNPPQIDEKMVETFLPVEELNMQSSALGKNTLFVI